MARSNSFDFSLNRDQLIERAYQLVNIYHSGDSIDAADMSFAVMILNAMLKEWSVDEKLWKRKQATLFTTLDTASYSLSSSGAHCTNSYVRTTLSSAPSAGATTLALTSSSGMAVGDNIGIKLSDGTRSWTTISTIPDSTSVTIPALSGAAESGASVVSYTSKIQRPLRILRGTWANLSNTNLAETQLHPYSYDDYFDLPIKTTGGSPSGIYYDKQLDSGVLYVYQRPNNVDYIINFSYFDFIMDMDASTNDFDFPVEWTWCLLVNLGVRLGMARGKSESIQSYMQVAQTALDAMKAFDSDTEALNIGLE